MFLNVFKFDKIRLLIIEFKVSNYCASHGSLIRHMVLYSRLGSSNTFGHIFSQDDWSHYWLSKPGDLLWWGLLNQAVLCPSVVHYHNECTKHLIMMYLCFQYELIYLVFGRHNFSAITANLDVFLRRFNEIQYWVITEMCLTQPLSKRVQLLRKFIKIAA